MSRWWPESARRSTALAAVLLSVAVFALGWWGIREFVSVQLSRDAVRSTRAQLDRVADAYRLGALDSAVLSGDAQFEVVADDGRAVVHSTQLSRLDPAWRPLPPAPVGAPDGWTTTTTEALHPGTHPQWREYRTYTVVGTVVDNVPAALVEPTGRTGSTVAEGLAPSTSGAHYRLTVYLFVLPWDTLNTLKLFDETLAVFVPVAVLLTALVAWLAAGRALRPVEAIRRELAEVSASQLGRRVPVPRSRDEIARLANTTNATLDRLQHTHEQQERFVADASHELRSPLANLRTGLEVALAHPERADWPAVAERSLLDVGRLHRITADLLQLAVDPGGVARVPVDLADVVREQVAERSAGSGKPAVRSFVDGPAVVLGEPVQLERLLRNLLDNAVRHASSAVTVTVGHHAGTVVLEVLDDGPGIPPAERERVFDRFARLDDARTRDAGGSGLGLTLAREIARRHGGSLVVADSATGACLLVRLPAEGA
ncbi:ATP-binding protein [Amycolatopsis rhabdoformis]|uniref:histidine kinase n=1 Tax=Amycolatopsis rhabdoformis TaxID=1448059 RepID=A0ABZ1IJ24_9PSEU|nr:ATP-binding protein [Amycolatopsis rhabdoformis]WSE33708.1 ATP-binding protein [Amycolatopsis rhabdoformis]